MRSEDKLGLGVICSRWSSIRESMTGTTTMAVTWCFSTSSNRVAGLNRRRSTSVVPNIIAMVACRKPSAWNIGAGSEVTSPALNGTCESTPPIGASDGGAARLAPLGVPGGAAGQDDDRRVLGGFGSGPSVAAGDDVGQGLVGAARRGVARAEPEDSANPG